MLDQDTLLKSSPDDMQKAKKPGVFTQPTNLLQKVSITLAINHVI